LVPEYARTYLELREGHYGYADLKYIAEGHINYIAGIERKTVTVFDTFLLNLKIWSLRKFGICDPYIEDNLWSIDFDRIFLLYPDIEWRYDPLRESRDERHAIFGDFQAELNTKGLQYSIIKGTGVNRMNSCLEDMDVN
jgi:nicotinamide riboside kinase